METLWAEQALTGEGWQRDVRVAIAGNGRIAAIDASSPPLGQRAGILLPAPVNLHSHAFQRALAGLTEQRGPDPRDSFWTWRRLMYRFLDRLGPEEIESIAAFVQMQMLEAGYAAVAEFHYVHHQPGGTPYDNLAELSCRIVAAASETGIGLTLLPVLYQHGGCGSQALQPGQLRFGNQPDRFARLHEEAGAAVRTLAADACTGVGGSFAEGGRPRRARIRRGARASGSAAHSRRRADGGGRRSRSLPRRASGGVDPGQRRVDERWCLIHATHMTSRETAALAGSGAVAGLCPITEASLGDGIFDGAAWLAGGGRFGVGSDSNIRISLAEELRMLEYSQRLRDRARAVLARPQASTGRALFEAAVRGGAQAAMRDAGTLSPGRLADLVALDSRAADLNGKRGDTLLDSFIFAGDDRMVTDLWSAGRHVVKDGRHIRHDEIARRYIRTTTRLRVAL